MEAKMSTLFLQRLQNDLAEAEGLGLKKVERSMTSAQGTRVIVNGRSAINLCANNYLGLADHPTLKSAARYALNDRGYGMASVRFICGTQDLHRQLEHRLAQYLDTDDSILFAACFDANGGVFEPLFGAGDAIVSDALNHASLIDGIRLCKARRYRFANGDMDALETELKRARSEGARDIVIVTDGVFSMDGTLADLPGIRLLADRYEALVLVDDCHATGFMGPKGAGTPAHFDVPVDILTGTLGKALGGAMGGFVAGPQAVIDTLRQKARPYLFSNALPPSVVAAGLAALDLVEAADDLRTTLFARTDRWRKGLTDLGFELLPGEHPIVPVMIHDAAKAQAMANALFEHGVYASGFFYPVVPKGQARIRTQMNAALTVADLDEALHAFERAGRETGVIA